MESLPVFVSYHVFWPFLVLTDLNEWFSLNPVQVLMDKIEQIVDQLGGILLAITTKASDSGSEHALQFIGSRTTFTTVPHRFHESAVCLG